jgi:hypothetical protein
VKARSTSQANACINNMRQIDGAIQEFAIETGKKVGDTINYPSDLTPYLKMNAANSVPPCPAGGVYTVSPVASTPSVVCSLGNTVTPAHTW